MTAGGARVWDRCLGGQQRPSVIIQPARYGPNAKPGCSPVGSPGRALCDLCGREVGMTRAGFLVVHKPATEETVR